MSQPETILATLDKLKKQIDQVLQKLKHATKTNDKNLYQKKLNELKNLLTQISNELEKAKMIYDETENYHPEIRFGSKIDNFVSYVQNIPSQIPEMPNDGTMGGSNAGFYQNDNIEHQALLDENEYNEQNNLVQQMYKDQTEQIAEIVDKMQDLNTGFTKLHALTEVQQTQIDNIESNILTTDERVEEAKDEIEKAHEYQKKSTKKLLVIFMIVGVMAVVIVGIIVVICVIKFTDKDKSNDETSDQKDVNASALNLLKFL